MKLILRKSSLVILLLCDPRSLLSINLYTGCPTAGVPYLKHCDEANPPLFFNEPAQVCDWCFNMCEECASECSACKK